MAVLVSWGCCNKLTQTAWFKRADLDFPGGTVDKESACQCRVHGFDPWSEKIPRAMEQLSPCAATKEPVCCN